MRYSLQCPKCNSNHIVEIKGYKSNQFQRIPLHRWGMKTATLDRYICADCGYTEEFVQLNDAFRKWVKKYDEAQRKKRDDFV